MPNINLEQFAGGDLTPAYKNSANEEATSSRIGRTLVAWNASPVQEMISAFQAKVRHNDKGNTYDTNDAFGQYVYPNLMKILCALGTQTQLRNALKPNGERIFTGISEDATSAVKWNKAAGMANTFETISHLPLPKFVVDIVVALTKPVFDEGFMYYIWLMQTQSTLDSTVATLLGSSDILTEGYGISPELYYTRDQYEEFFLPIAKNRKEHEENSPELALMISTIDVNVGAGSASYSATGQKLLIPPKAKQSEILKAMLWSGYVDSVVTHDNPDDTDDDINVSWDKSFTMTEIDAPASMNYSVWVANKSARFLAVASDAELGNDSTLWKYRNHLSKELTELSSPLMVNVLKDIVEFGINHESTSRNTESNGSGNKRYYRKNKRGRNPRNNRRNRFSSKNSYTEGKDDIKDSKPNDEKDDKSKSKRQ
jgi:hypothetical protein